MLRYTVNKIFYMSEVHGYRDGNADFSKFCVGDIIGDFESVDYMQFKDTLVPVGLPSTALAFLTYLDTVPDPVIPGSGGGGGGGGNTTLSSNFIVPAVNVVGNAAVVESSGYSIGSYILMNDGTEGGLFLVDDIPDSTHIDLRTVRSDNVGGVINSGTVVNETGNPAYTYLSSAFTIPAVTATGVANVFDTEPYSLGQTVYINDGSDGGYFELKSKTDTTMTLETVQSSQVGNVISAGEVVTHSAEVQIERINKAITSGLNGVNTTFTIPGGDAYQPDSLIVYLNGVAYDPDNIQENGLGYTTFTIINGDIVPISSDSLAVSYYKQ